MTDYISEFLDFLASNGCSPASSLDIVADDMRHYFQISGDKPSEKRGSYCLKLEGDVGIGWARNHRFGETYGYVSKSAKKLSPEDKAAFQVRQKEAKLRQQQEELKEWASAAESAKVIWNLATPAIEHPYLTRKQIQAHGARVYNGNLLIPLYADNKLWSLQMIDAEGNKLYAWYSEAGELVSGRKKGCFYPLATKDEDKSVILLAEGFSTSASIREATGLPVVCCLDSGNLKPVAEAFRLKYPESKFVIASDNDRFTLNSKKQPHNIGIVKAQEAAGIIGAGCIWPEFPEDDISSSDFNDIAVLYDKQYIIDRIIQAIPKIDPISEPDNNGGEVVSILDTSVQNLPTTPPEKKKEKKKKAPVIFNITPDDWPFKILGHNEGNYYFLSQESGQIVTLTASGLANMPNLFVLGEKDFWTQGNNEASLKRVAIEWSNSLVKLAHRVGVFQPTKIRGIGAWLDDGRKVVHCGDKLVEEGREIIPHEYESNFVYPARMSNINLKGEPLTNHEAVRLREILSKISWESKLSGDLMAGWCVIAPVCAALKWRPHVWLVGATSSGKSTILESIVMPVVGTMALRFDGSTTEAAVRQTLGVDGRPIMYDEAEAESMKDKNIMEGILLLARRASSGASIVKGGAGGEAMEFPIRSCFCFSAINPMIKNRADENRITQMVLKKSDKGDEYFKALKKEIKETITPEYGRRMLSRTVKYLDVLLDNCEVFVDAAAEVLCDRRAADQLGSMLAGLFLLTSTERITYERAVAWIKSHNWSMHTTIGEQNDPEKLLMHIMSKFVKFGTKEDTIGSLIKKAVSRADPNPEALDTLRKYGIWPREGQVWISNKSPNIQDLLKDTPWHDWKRPLMDILGAERKDPAYFTPGLNQRSVAVPLAAFHLDEDDGQPELSYGNEEEIPFV